MYSGEITFSNRPDRVAQLAEHWASIPNVVGNRPSIVKFISHKGMFPRS